MGHVGGLRDCARKQCHFEPPLRPRAESKKQLGGWAVLGGVIHSFRCTKGMWGPRASVGFRDEFLEAESCDLTGLKAQKLYVRNVGSKFLLQ